MDDPLNAFVSGTAHALPTAEGGPLAGLTLAVKDIYDVEGLPTGCGNPARLAQAQPAARSAPAVQSLLDAGARFTAKTQTDELAFSLMGQNAHFPWPVNPRARTRVTGGSSSGSAAAVAGGLAGIALGSDTGGSIRAPASFCGLIGLRTTHGAIALNGVMPLAPSFDTVGWFARDVDAYERVAGVLLPDATVGTARPRVFAAPALDALVVPAARPEYGRMAAFAADVLGAPVPLVLSQAVDDLYWAFRKLQAAEAWAVHGAWIEGGDRQLGEGVRERFAFGKGVARAEVEAETRRREAFRAELAEALGEDGLLVLPTVPGAAPLSASPPAGFQAYREQALRMLCWSGLSGFPQITMPLGETEGAPFGLSLLGPAGSDRTLIRLGRALLDGAAR